MKIGEVEPGKEYTLDAWRTNVTHARAVRIVTREEPTTRHSSTKRNVRVVELVATRVSQGYGIQARQNHKVGDTLVLPAREIKTTAAEADHKAAEQEARRDAEQRAMDALAAVGLEARRYSASYIHIVLGLGDAYALADRLSKGDNAIYRLEGLDR